MKTLKARGSSAAINELGTFLTIMYAINSDEETLRSLWPLIIDLCEGSEGSVDETEETS